jgi:ATP synthase protein I
VQPKREVYQIIWVQCAVVLLLSLCFGFGHIAWAKDAALGGLAAILPNVFFAWRLFSKTQQKVDKKLFKAVYGALLQKFGFSIILLLWMMTLSTNKIALLSGFLGVHWGLWLMPSVLNKKLG